MQSTDQKTISPANEEELYRQARQVLPGGISRNAVFRKPHPHYAMKASGCYITDINGVVRVDFANNMASMIHGHSHPAIVKAVMEQIQSGTGFTLATEAEIRYAQLLCERVPSFEQIRFVNSGTEAVMYMIKAARAYTGRPAIAKAEGAYHGGYDFAEVSQLPNPANWGDIGAPNSVPLAHGTPKAVTDNVIIFPFNDIERTLKILDRRAGDIACVLIDPCPHRVGLITATDEFIEALRRWTVKNGALLAFDEVISFRLNYRGAQECYSTKPDITSIGKIIGGGFPVGAMAGRRDVMKVLDPTESRLLFPLSGTFSANPVTMTAGHVAMKMYDQETVNRLNALTKNAVAQINDVIKTVQVPACITGSGSMFRIHLRATPPASYRDTFESKEISRLVTAMLDHLYEQRVIMTGTFSAMLSTVTTQKEIDMLTSALESGFRMIKPPLERIHNQTV